MRVYFYFIFLFPFISVCQTEYFTISSETLQDEREIKVQLPRTYNSNEDKRYPLIFVFDGDYLFEPVAGVVDYLSYWDEIPEAIVIGINQSKTRDNDFQIGPKRNLPAGFGSEFFDFIQNELLFRLKNRYRISRFKVAIGHDRSANFINFFLLRKNLLFNAYISLSPQLSTEMAQRVESALKNTKAKLFYHLSYGERDFELIEQKVKPLGKRLEKIENPNLEMDFGEIKQATHFTMASRSIPTAIEKIFSVYRPITPTIYEEELLKANDVIDYLEQKYTKMEDLYALEIPVSINDILFVGKAIKEREEWTSLKELGKIALKNQPESLLGDYYKALYFEKKERPKKAVSFYQRAYRHESVEGIESETMLDRANELRQLYKD